MVKWMVRIGILAVSFVVGIAGVSVVGRLSDPPTCVVTLQESAKSMADEALDDEWAVYLAVMKEEGSSPSSVLILDASSVFYSDMAILTTEKPTTDLSAAADYYQKNRREVSLRELFGTKPGASFVTRADLDALNQRYYWQEFHLLHPATDGYMWFSRVGFNDARTEAMLHFGMACGGLCGHGATWTFTKVNGVWLKTGSIGSEWAS